MTDVQQSYPSAAPTPPPVGSGNRRAGLANAIVAAPKHTPEGAIAAMEEIFDRVLDARAEADRPKGEGSAVPAAWMRQQMDRMSNDNVFKAIAQLP
jgi:hypothetical protein